MLYRLPYPVNLKLRLDVKVSNKNVFPPSSINYGCEKFHSNSSLSTQYHKLVF